MNYYIRDFHFSRKFGKTYLVFEFFIGDKWRVGKIQSDNITTDISSVTSVIINYIDTFIEKKSKYSKEEVKKMVFVSEQLIKGLGETSKLYK